MSFKRFIILIVVVIVSISVIYVFFFSSCWKNYISRGNTIDSFEKCMAQDNASIMESYPRQCKIGDGETFTEDIGNEMDKINLINIITPRPNQVIQSPLEINGQARGTWFFEGDFPIKLLDENGEELVVGFATAQTDWMTEEFVQFEALIEFEIPTSKKGTLILIKDNASGLPEHDDELRVPVLFK